MSSKPNVIFYTKPGCHLCDVARDEIARAGAEGEFTFEEVNVESDPALKSLYGWDIPVVVINGTVAFKHRLTAGDFLAALRKYGQ